MVITQLGNLDISSMMPNMYTASSSMVLQTLALAVGIFLLVKLLQFIHTVIRLERQFGKLPGPKSKDFFRGSFKEFPTDPEERLMKLVEWTNQYGKERGYFRVWLDWVRPLIHLCHPETMKTIMLTAEPKHITGVSAYLFFKPWLGDGLLVSGGRKWARNRRLLTPAFHFDILKQYMQVYNRSTDVLIKKLDKFAVTETTFDVFQNICLCTLDIILKCAFSYNEDVQQTGETHPYVVAVTELSVAVADRFSGRFNKFAALYLCCRNPFLTPDLTFYLSPTGRKFKKNCGYVHSVAEEIIDKRRATLQLSGGTCNKKNLDFLDILLTAKDDSGEGLSPLDIRNEVDTFLFEGHDTTASAISWILYSLAEHPEYQRKCQAEIDGILDGRETDDIEWADLPRLEYLTMCIKEGMRLHAPVPIVSRQTSKEMMLGDTVIPKHTTVTINIWALHHNEDVWGADHMEYKPDRFTKDNTATMHAFQFTPFSGGPRNCIGQNFAINEEKTVLSKLLYNFNFKLDPDHTAKKQLAAVMRAANGIKMFVERRKR